MPPFLSLHAQRCVSGPCKHSHAGSPRNSNQLCYAADASAEHVPRILAVQRCQGGFKDSLAGRQVSLLLLHETATVEAQAVGWRAVQLKIRRSAPPRSHRASACCLPLCAPFYFNSSRLLRALPTAPKLKSFVDTLSECGRSRASKQAAQIGVKETVLLNKTMIRRAICFAFLLCCASLALGYRDGDYIQTARKVQFHSVRWGIDLS